MDRVPGQALRRPRSAAGRGERQPDDEPGALRAVLDRDRATVLLDGLAAEGEAEPGAAGVAAAPVREADERLEDPFPVLGGDPGAVVLLDHDGLVTAALDGDVDPGLGVPLRVGD